MKGNNKFIKIQENVGIYVKYKVSQLKMFYMGRH